jgi:hypothetical protein
MPAVAVVQPVADSVTEPICFPLSLRISICSPVPVPVAIVESVSFLAPVSGRLLWLPRAAHLLRDAVMVGARP